MRYLNFCLRLNHRTGPFLLGYTKDVSLEPSSVDADQSTPILHDPPASNQFLQPEIWQAVEALISPEIESRWEGLRRVFELDALRASPLVAYVFATRITEPEPELREQFVRALGALFLPSSDGSQVSEAVIQTLTYYLNHMRMRQVFSLLQVWQNQPETRQQVIALLDACPYAGNYLVNIVNERKFKLALRIRAAEAIGLVGFLDALPALERAAVRMEARTASRNTLPLALNHAEDETALLPAIREAIDLLRAP
jgi:hypothetical protein